MTAPANRELVVESLQREWSRFCQPLPPPVTVIDAHVGADADGDPIFQVVYRLLGSSEVLGAQVAIVDDPDHLSRFFEQILFELFDEPNDTSAGLCLDGVRWWKPRGLRPDQLFASNDTRVSMPHPML
ncbi:MAG: hypothetical protein QM582_17905 [Micropruina sp.]|uniref:hypothetical protein n=1 Tax=Micropruina sp. TaxID=2737536 RepID=UPI0039E5D5DC